MNACVCWGDTMRPAGLWLAGPLLPGVLPAGMVTFVRTDLKGPSRCPLILKLRPTSVEDGSRTFAGLYWQEESVALASGFFPSTTPAPMYHPPRSPSQGIAASSSLSSSSSMQCSDSGVKESWFKSGPVAYSVVLSHSISLWKTSVIRRSWG